MVEDPYNLHRFVHAQEGDYAQALQEIRAGRKRSHWMWYIFPQIDGLGFSAMAQHYAIQSVDEARAYLDHPTLGPRLRECAEAVVAQEGRSATETTTQNSMRPDTRQCLSNEIPPETTGYCLRRNSVEPVLCGAQAAFQFSSHAREPDCDAGDRSAPVGGAFRTATGGRVSLDNGVRSAGGPHLSVAGRVT